mgnify:CR=1 FL=1
MRAVAASLTGHAFPLFAYEYSKQKYFLQVYKKAYKKYGKRTKRLAGEGWGAPWKTLIVTIMSAQSRDETTIPIAEKLFVQY